MFGKKKRRSRTSAIKTLVRKQEVEIRKAFEVLSRNSNGFINFEDFSKLVEGMELPYNPKHLIEAFKEADAKGDGKIDCNQFIEMLITHMIPDFNDQVDLAFEIFDYNKDSVLTLDDLRSFVKENGEQYDEEELLEMINEADLDCMFYKMIQSQGLCDLGKGSITKEEFRNMMTRSQEKLVKYSRSQDFSSPLRDSRGERLK